ncbi:CAP domain-containing protein [Streptomyces sp. 4N509B]|uniref:CAP domain-containing protein n=1 Tax=Streptomyces sp. 4N509B TaxID=3457413 RepID=UPI003FD0AB4F
MKAIAKSPNSIDLLVTGNDRQVYPSWWYAGSDWSGIHDNWRGLWHHPAAFTEEKQMLELINDARQHPEKYPPHGNATGAAMAACARGFELSEKLTEIAAAHSGYLKDQSKEWATTGDNMHRGPGGKLVWESGEPMDQAGYRAWRAENVAVGFATLEEAVRFWMQDDERFAWGHRNAILRCETLEAGVGHFEGGPWGHYWTLDMGTK